MNLKIKDIVECLKQAQEESRIVLTINGIPNIEEMGECDPPESIWKGRRAMDRFLDEGTWQTEGPGFKQLREWVEFHWNPKDDKEGPNGAVATGDDWGIRRENQLDSVTATKKLIVAAKLYGREQVSKCAADFASHGMIEVRRIFLLKGPPIEAALLLDNFCSLLPYGQALEGINAETDPTNHSIVWPEPNSDNVCALEGRYFEKAAPQCNGNGQYTSPFLKDGPGHLALLLGLVWGDGYRILGNWEGVHQAAEATLPYRSAAMRSGQGIRSVPLALRGYGPPPKTRPLAVRRLHGLAASLSAATEDARGRLVRAMERVRDSAERLQFEDKVIDVGAALSILFTEDEDQEELVTLIPARAAWYFSDSHEERHATEAMLSEIFEGHSRVVRGRAFEESGQNELDRSGRLLADAENVLRACLMSMIAEGCPEDWDEAMSDTALRVDPPKAESEVLSVKSDPLSWSIEEQREIDRALEAVWRPVIEEAPLPPRNVSATVASGDLSQNVKRYFERGIPYVVPHPARLYMAHPRWPKVASDPIDVSTRYYCGRDVERHLRQWMDAAASKGLVQIKVPNNVDLYHPKYRDDWPHPLLSSHEDEASAQNPHPRDDTGEVASTGRSVPDAVNEQEQRSAAGEQPTDPPSTLPQSVITGLGENWQRLWLSFQHDVNVLTDSLLRMLNAIHEIHLEERQRLMQVVDDSDGAIKTLEDALSAAGDDYRGPEYPKLRGFPELKNEPLFVRTEPGGSMEQTAFNGWVVEVYSIWETSYRNQLRHDNRKIPGVIRPQNQAIGELGHIRNDLVHNGIAKPRETGRCEVLTWFSVSERIQVRMRHVIDFMNQMAWLHQGSPALVTEQGKVISWRLDKEAEPETPTPALISVRPFVNPLEQDPRYRYGASVAFENGVFGTTPMGPEHEENQAQAETRAQNWMRMTINEHGDLHVPDFGTILASDLYIDYLKGESRPGAGIPGTWTQFKE